MWKYLIFIYAFCLLTGFVFLPDITSGQGNVVWTNSWPKKNSPDAGYDKIRRVKYTTLYHSEVRGDTYHHHPAIAHYNGILYASWSSSFRDEDAPGQHIWYTFTTDKTNKNWEKSQVLFPHQDSIKARGNPGRAMIPLGFCKIGEEIYAIAEVFDWTADEKREGKGRLARSVNTHEELGEIFWLISDPPAPKPGFPTYKDATNPEIMEIAGEINVWLSEPFNSPAWDFKNNTSEPLADDGHQMCEMTKAVELSDTVYMRMYRDCDGRLRNYIQLSRDQGKTWDKPSATNIPDSNSKTYLGQLPDSQIFMINNAIDKIWQRDPLSISLINDRNEFYWTGNIKYDAPEIRFKGAHKGPGFQYPSAVITSEYLWVVYSVGKEDIEVARIPLSSLQDKK